MTSDNDVLERLEAFHDHIAVPHRSPEDLVRQGRARVRRTRGVVAGGAALGVAALVAALSWGGGVHENDRLLPAGPSPSTASSAAPPMTVPVHASESMAPLRPHHGEILGMGLAPHSTVEEPLYESTDPTGDSARDAVDIEAVSVRNIGGDVRLDWAVRVRGEYPTAAEPGLRIEYGIVLDKDGDTVPDCQIGISSEVGGADQSFSSWVTNLRTGVTERDDAPSYGGLFDFAHPAERAPGAEPSHEMRFYFFHDDGPCGGYNNSSAFYTWAALGDGRHASIVDHAPDNVWLRMPRA